MLEEWIRNVPMALVERIVADAKMRGSHIEALARTELQRRRELLFQAA